MKQKQNIPLNLRERTHVKISLVMSIVVLILTILFFNQLDYRLIQKPADDLKKQEEIARKKAEEEALKPVVTTANVIAVGDNLFHTGLLDSGKNDEGAWNYDHIYDHVRDEIQAADIAMVDQETVFTNNHSAISGYPSFATPTEVGDALVNAGFDVIESATNHIDDYGYDYMAQTFEFWKKYPDIPVLGIHETQEEANTIRTMTVNDITISFLDYTYGTNNSGAGEGRDYMISIFDTNKVSADIKKAKEISDCLIFVAHWGKEDETMPTEYEKQWANFLLKEGVDVLIGGHPHVLQPYGRLSDESGNEMLVFYSLGNFVSTQQNLKELLGGMAKFTIQKTVDQGVTSIDFIDATVEPLVMHYNHDEGVYAPYMLKDYTEELATSHSMRYSIGSEFSLENLKAKFEEIMSMNVEPSEDTDYLNVDFTVDGMIDRATQTQISDMKSVSASQYFQSLGSASDTNTGYESYYDNYDSYYSGYDSYYDNSYDSYYDSYDSYYDNSYDSYYDSYDSYY